MEGGGFARYRLIIEPWLAFLGHTQDNYLFQDKSVIDIVDELLSDWKDQGKLVPAWRWQLTDPAAYPKRGMTVQYRESDLAFLKRLLAEEGLFCWFEHSTDTGDTLGSHTLVIADSNQAFQPNTQPRIRYTQAGATLAEDAQKEVPSGDSLDRWHGLRQLDTAETHAASWDYRRLTVSMLSSVWPIDFVAPTISSSKSGPPSPVRRDEPKREGYMAGAGLRFRFARQSIPVTVRRKKR